jgi:hypothetical protein
MQPFGKPGADAHPRLWNNRTAARSLPGASADLRHGALCLTEPLPGAGAEAISLYRAACFWPATGQTAKPLLEIHKRGRFTSHMDFAEFVVAAVEGDGERCARQRSRDSRTRGRRRVRARLAPVRKLGHRFASTTNPVFDLSVPASRIVGGYTDGRGRDRSALQPSRPAGTGPAPDARPACPDDRRQGALHRARVVRIHRNRRAAERRSFRLDMADLWATGEAAASLGFSRGAPQR